MRDPRNTVILVLSVATAFLAGMVVARPGDVLAQQGGGGGGGTVSSNQRMIAATGSVGSGMSVLWLVDTEKNRLLVYGTNSLGKALELRAARRIDYDLKLDEYHDESQYRWEDLARLARRAGEPESTPAGKENAPAAPRDPAPPPPPPVRDGGKDDTRK
jgi:hypothetical protein